MAVAATLRSAPSSPGHVDEPVGPSSVPVGPVDVVGPSWSVPWVVLEAASHGTEMSWSPSSLIEVLGFGASILGGKDPFSFSIFWEKCRCGCN